ncbi:autotransporter domain-containing protein [Sebaldella sp. S0638]|uniref:autotransporter domain-containing protein n=1 Tax=Sebaldella sp. S0638 TaxID=2957809 RepID=UPI00209CB548|nr:autotransporter domain-containing protein [Sebaldella sp. S0638]MCP1223576.1 autotransporter domain-containing protein [Sebaldella sp. S0638]
MKRNKKMLVLFLSLNSILVSHENIAEKKIPKNGKYENIYNSMTKNLKFKKSNQKNYQLIEELLNKKNKELKDLYLQGEYIVKPEYLEWQVFFTEFYAEKKNKDNTLENAVFHSVPGTKTINDFSIKPYKPKDLPSKVRPGATVPVKEILDFTLNPEIKITEKVINPIVINLPNTKAEKILMTDFKGIAAPTPQTPTVNISVNPTVSMNSPEINFNFNAGHNGGAPKRLGGNRYVYTTLGPRGTATSIRHTGSSEAIDRYFIVNAKNRHELYFSQGSDFTISNTAVNAGGRFFAENEADSAILANYGKLSIGTGSADIFIFGDTVDSTGYPNNIFSTSVYNSGIMTINADSAGGQAGIPGGVGMAYLSNGDDGNMGAKQRYLVNGKNGIMNVNGWGNYGILMNQVDSLPDTHGTSIMEEHINLLINKGQVIINITGRDDTHKEGNVGVAAFADNSVNTGNDNSFMLNDSEGIIRSESGNNILLRHMGTGEVWNKGVLEINSSETIGMDKRNWLYNSAAANPISEARGVNDGIIIVSTSVKDVKAVSGLNDTKKHDNSRNSNKTVIIKNGDGNAFGSDYNDNGLIDDTITKDISKGKLGKGETVSGNNTIVNASENMVADDTILDKDDDLDNIIENKSRSFDITINQKTYNYTTQDGVIFLGGRNSAGLAADVANINSFAPDLNLMKAVNERDGKIFIYSTGNTSNQYTIGINGLYSTLENKGGIFLGLTAQNGTIAGLASNVLTESGIPAIGQYNYIGIYGKGSDITNSGIITDKATSDGLNYSQKAIGIYAEADKINNVLIGNVVNSGTITLGTGGSAIIAKGRDTAGRIELTNTGEISVAGDQNNQGSGFTLENVDAVISKKINLGGENTVGIYGKSSVIELSDLEISGKNIKKSLGVVADNTELIIKNGVKINLLSDNNIGIYGENLIYTDGITGKKSDYLTIDVGNGGIGTYLTGLMSDMTLKINTITTGNSTETQLSGGIYATSLAGSVNINSGTIKIGSSLENGSGFGIYAIGKKGTSGSINTGVNDLIVNQKSSLGIYADNITNIASGNITAGTTGVYQNNSLGTGTLKTGKITLTGNADNMIGIYTTGNIIDVEINGLEVKGLNKLTGIYVGKGGFKNTGNISISSGNESYGVYIKGDTLNKTVDFGSGTSNIVLGNESLGLYLDNTNVTGSMPENITVGNSSSSGKQSVGIYVKNTVFSRAVSTNVTSGKESVGVYFDSGTGNVEYNGDVKLGENSLGIYSKDSTLRRDPNSSVIFTGTNNISSTGFYLENSVLNFTSDELNEKTLSMDSGIAFLMKGNNSKITVNGEEITPEQLDKLGLAPKVDRIVYTEKDETIRRNITLNPLERYYGHRAKDGRLEISGNIYTADNIISTYGVAAQNRYNNVSASEEVLLNKGYTIDMSNSLGSVGIQSLAGARTISRGKIIVGSNSDKSAGIGILAESNTEDLTSVINDKDGIIEMPDAGIGIYLDSVELGGSIINEGTINSLRANAVGIYGKMSSEKISDIPVSKIQNTGSINLSDNGYGIFTDNSIIENSGNIMVDNSQSNKIIAIYGGKNSYITNLGGNISVGEGGIGFYGNNSSMVISGGTFSTEKGTLIYGENNSNIFYTADGTTLGNKIGIYLDQSKIDFGGKKFTVADSGSGIYLFGANANAESLGTLALGNDSEGVYVKNGILNNLGGVINIEGTNSTGIIGVNSNIENTTVINSGTLKESNSSKGILVKINDGETYTLTNKADINISGADSLGIYGSTIDENNKVSGTLNIINESNIKMDSVSDISDMITGIYGTKNVNIITSTGNISGGNYTVGIYSAGGNVIHNSEIALGDAAVGIYISEGTGTAETGSSVAVGNGIKKIISGNEVIERSVAFYTANKGVFTNYSSDITVGDDGIIGYSKGAGSKILNYGNLTFKEEGVGFYTNGGEAENAGILSSAGNGIIYMYGKDGKISNNGNINGSGNDYGIGIYGKNSEIINTANIHLGDTYLNPAKISDASDPSHRYAIGIYGEESKIYNNGEIKVGENGIGFYSYGQIGDIINDVNGKILSSSDDAMGLIVEGSGKYSVINNGSIILSGKNVIGASISKGTTLINNGLIEVSGEKSVGIMADGNSRVINNSVINTKEGSIAGVVLRGNSVLENNGTITGLILSDDVSKAISEKSGSSTSATSIDGYIDKLPDTIIPSYAKPTIINSGIIIVNENFQLDNINLIIKPDLLNPSTSIIKGDNTDFIYDAVKVSGGTIRENAAVEVTPDFAEGTSAETIQLMKVFTGSGNNKKNFYITSQSLLWSITPTYNEEDGRSIDLVATKKTFGSFSQGLWYENFADNLDKNYKGSTGDALKIYNKTNWLTSEKDLRRVMASLAGNVYANINQREMSIESALDSSISFLQNSPNNTKENIKINIIGGKGKTKDNTDGVVPYDYRMTGITALREVERTYRHTFGYSFGYVNTNFDMDDGNKSKETVNSVQLGLYNKYTADNWVIKNNLTGRVSFHDMDRNIIWPEKYGRSNMESRYEVYSMSSDNILGKKLSIGKNVSIVPYGAVKAVYITRPDFNEDGLEKLEVKGNDALSIKPRAGIELEAGMPIKKDSEWRVKSALDLAYEYELADINEKEYARLTAVENNYHELSKPGDEKGAFRGKASVGIEVEDRYGIFITGEYTTDGKENKDYRAGLALKAVF